jgi:hypothetical protein
MRRSWTVAALVALGLGCAGRKALLADNDGEPPQRLTVETGVFRRAGLLTPEWVLDPADPRKSDVRLQAHRNTEVIENGQLIGLDLVQVGERVRVAYLPREGGPGRIDRIDILPEQPTLFTLAQGRNGEKR